MSLQIENALPVAKNSATEPGAEKSERAEFKKFCATSASFLFGLFLASLALNAAIGAYLHRAEKRGGLGAEVQMAVERVEKNRGDVRIIFLGDSVSRQLFRPNTEPNDTIRFLTTNQAITMAGQCYLAEGAFRQCPNISDVYLFYLPAAWRNDMPRDFTHDYFCGHFHTAAEVVEVFKVKRDIELTLAHAGRWLWPNIMAANSLSRPAFALQPDAREPSDFAKPAGAPPDPERWLTVLSSCMAPPEPAIPIVPRGQQPVILSPVSRYYLAKLRQDCLSRHIHLHVLPCPVSDQKIGFEFVDPDHVYDGPMIGDVPASHLMDSVHFKHEYIQRARERMIATYGLDFLR